MGRTALEMTSAEMKAFRPAAAIEKRRAALQSEAQARWEEAQQVARQAAHLLRTEFGAERVQLFGSTVHRSWYTIWSDIDLAAWGIPADRYFAAVAAVERLSADFQIDVVDPEDCKPSIRAAILRDGVDL